MAQILDLSKKYSSDQLEAAMQSVGAYNDPPAGGYVCKIVDAILNDNSETGKANIELLVDIAEGEYSGYFQNLEDRFGFWGLRGFMSFKEEALPRFKRTCAALCNSNPGLAFNPFAPGGADIDSLKGKQIGVVTQKEEYQANNGTIRERHRVYFFTEVSAIKEGHFKVPDTKRLEHKVPDISVAPGSKEEIPF